VGGAPPKAAKGVRKRCENAGHEATRACVCDCRTGAGVQGGGGDRGGRAVREGSWVSVDPGP